MENVSIKSIYQRLKAETPSFWKKVRKMCIWLGSLGLIIKTAIETNSMDLDWMQADYYNTMILVGAIGTAMSSLTVSPPEIKETDKDEPETV